MGFDKKEYHAVILGALLHDIGKFVQRAQENPTMQDHSHWGEEWFQNNLAEKLTGVFNEGQKKIIRLAINNHHGHEKYISLADAISAGMDHIGLDDEEKGDPFSDRLTSIFSRVSISNRARIEKYHKFASLGIKNLEEIFPIGEKTCSSEEYATLLNEFEKEIKSIDFHTFTSEKTIDLIYFFLWKYCWCIPSATYKTEPDVSLFDHLKTTAAIAGSLYAFQEDTSAESLSMQSNALSLIGGDILGIQSYIFDVLTQQGKVAKRLRARSFFIQLISEIAGHKILHAFKLPLCNIVITGGGNFYILAPNLKDKEKILMELEKEFDKWTLDELNAEISVSLANIGVSGKDLMDFSKPLEELKKKLNYKKYNPHKLALSKGNSWLVQEFTRPEVIEGEEKICQGCRKHPKLETEDNTDNLCRNCLSDTKIGQSLTKKQILAFFNDALHEFRILNYSIELWDQIDLKNREIDEPYLILSLNTTDFGPPITGFRYLATHIPTQTDITKATGEEAYPITFDEIANTSKGDRLLGYLKCDVDNLGTVLRDGFKKTRPSISRFITFSRMLETFFNGYIQAKMSREHKEIYTVFSGGDDLFVLGPWNKTVDFARLIRHEFSHFCAENPDLTFSSGIFISKPHEPLSFCAEAVESRLRDSKRLEGKDRISLFNQPLNWKELDNVLGEARRFINWLEKVPPVISNKFVQDLRRYGEMAERAGLFKKGGDIETKYLKFVPLLVYEINRNLTRESQKDAFEWAVELRPTTDKPHGGYNLRYLRTIMEYVLTYTRS